MKVAINVATCWLKKSSGKHNNICFNFCSFFINFMIRRIRNNKSGNLSFDSFKITSRTTFRQHLLSSLSLSYLPLILCIYFSVYYHHCLIHLFLSISFSIYLALFLSIYLSIYLFLAISPCLYLCCSLSIYLFHTYRFKFYRYMSNPL